MNISNSLGNANLSSWIFSDAGVTVRYDGEHRQVHIQFSRHSVASCPSIAIIKMSNSTPFISYVVANRNLWTPPLSPQFCNVSRRDGWWLRSAFSLIVHTLHTPVWVSSQTGGMVSNYCQAEDCICVHNSMQVFRTRCC